MFVEKRTFVNTKTKKMKAIYFLVGIVAMLFDNDNVDSFVCWVINLIAMVALVLFVAVFGTALLALIL